MAAAPKIPVVVPADFDGVTIKQNGQGKWAIVPSAAKATVSADAGNLVVAGSDGGAELTAAAVKGAQAYASIVVDNVAKTVTFNDGKGTVTAVPLGTQDIHTSGLSLVGTVLHLQNSDGSADQTLDLGKFLTSVSVSNANGTVASGDGTAAHPITVTVVADPASGNLLTVSGAGLRVAKSDVLALLNAAVTLASAANTLTLTVNGTATNVAIVNSAAVSVDLPNGVAHVTVNGVDATVAVVELVDGSGNHVGSIFA